MHHRARRVIVASAVAVCIGAGAASAVSFMPQELLPAEEIIARYVDSIGGADAVRAHSSTQVQGTMELLGQGIQGEVRMYAAAPNKALMIVSFPDLGIESRQGYGATGGSVNELEMPPTAATTSQAMCSRSSSWDSIVSL